MSEGEREEKKGSRKRQETAGKKKAGKKGKRYERKGSSSDIEVLSSTENRPDEESDGEKLPRKKRRGESTDKDLGDQGDDEPSASKKVKIAEKFEDSSRPEVEMSGPKKKEKKDSRKERGEEASGYEAESEDEAEDGNDPEPVPEEKTELTYEGAKSRRLSVRNSLKTSMINLLESLNTCKDFDVSEFNFRC